jgi:hypothetical protein
MMSRSSNSALWTVFFRSAIDYVRGGAFLDTAELISQFTGAERTQRDRSIARRLIALTTPGGMLNDQERADALRFACDLLSDADVDEIGGLLKDDNESVREHAARRLKGIPGPKAKNALRKLEGDFDTFVRRCLSILQRAGVQASLHVRPYGKSVRLDAGATWLNMEFFYSERERPDFDEFFLQRVKFFLGRVRKPRKEGGRDRA